MPVEPRRRRPPPPQSPARIEPDAYVDPEGWVQEYDQATESHYYWHVSTGATQWEPPVTGYWNQARTHKVPVRASDANLSSISSTDSTMSPTEEAQLRETYSEVYLPTDYFCPITMEVMQEPVIAADGHSYEFKSLTNWFATQEQGGAANFTSPKTGAKLWNTITITNHTLKGAIAAALADAQVPLEHMHLLSMNNLTSSRRRHMGSRQSS